MLCNIYGPNGDNKAFFQDLGVRLQGTRSEALIVGGDLNTVHSTAENRQRGNYNLTPLPQVIGFFLHSFRSLGYGMFGEIHIRRGEITHARQSWSRIDYFLLSPQLLSKVHSTTIGPLVISDHSPIILHLADIYPRSTDYIWRFPTYLAKDDSFGKLLRGWWLEYTSSNAAHESDASLYWNTAKAVIRGRNMAFTRSHKKKKKQAYEAASTSLREAYTAFKRTPSSLTK